MLTSLSVQNFKAFADLTLPLKPISILLGPNNSGKSSVIAAIRLLAQTMQSDDPALPLLLDGPLGDFGTYRDIVYGNHRGRVMGIELGVSDGEVSPSIAVEYKYRTVRRELILRHATLEIDGAHLLTTEFSRDAGRTLVMRMEGRPVPVTQRGRASDVLRMNHFVPRFGYYVHRRGAGDRVFGLFDQGAFANFDEIVDLANDVIDSTLGEVEYVSAMRQPPDRTYRQTGAARARVGAAGEYWAGLFVLDQSALPRARKVAPRLTAWLRQAGLASDIRLNWLSDRYYEVQLKHPVSGEWENLADVGQANSQVIPVLVGGYRLPSGATFMVEEPEIHLHPAAQAELGDFFLQLYDDRIQSIVETHSEYLLLRLQQHVAGGRLPPADVGFYYVKATETGKRIDELALDRKGRFVKALDGGFFPQRLEEAKRLARLRADGS